MKKEVSNLDQASEKVPTERYFAGIDEGLSVAQVKRHISDGWTNKPVKSPSKTVPEIIKSNLFTYFNLVFAVLSVLLIIVRSFRSLTFLPIIIANILIGIVQEIRAKKVLDKLSVLNAPKATVIRDGIQTSLPTDKLVLDDIVIFSAGDQICADATVIDGELTVNESLLTGEPDEIVKKPGDTLMSGSFAVSGKAYARLEKVGADSYISKLTLEAKAMDNKERSEMIRSLDKLVGVMGILIIPIGILLFTQQYFLSGTSFADSIVSMVAAVIGMIPEGLYLLASVALVVSVMRLASKKVLVHDMRCIETLARVDVLCVDKTGTITENTMQVTDVIISDDYDEKTMPELYPLLQGFVSAMPSDNITMEALKRYFNKPAVRKAVSVSPFSSVHKYCGAVFEEGAYVLGAPEFVLHEDYDSYREQIESFSMDGFRVLLFGRYDGIPDGQPLEGRVVPYALILLSNPIRKSAPETFRYFANQGVDIKVISGDNPVTVSQIAMQAEIKGAQNYIDATTLHTKEDIKQAILDYTVFGRVTPDQKRQFVRALKSAGKTVGMTGDGVNDVLALKDADCSIAMASGCDAATKVSQLVLLESDFSCMPSVVAEGRRVVNNIERSASLFLVKNIFSIMMSIFSVCFAINYPLVPSQLSLISMFTIGIPAFFLAMQPNKSIIRGKFMTNVLLKALPAGITDFLVVGALVMFGKVFSVDPTDISTACTMLLSIVGFMILYHISKPMDKVRWAIFTVCIAGLVLCSIFLSNLFAIEHMSLQCVMLFVVFAIVTEPFMRYGTAIFGWIENKIKRNAKRAKRNRKA